MNTGFLEREEGEKREEEGSEDGDHGKIETLYIEQLKVGVLYT